MRTQLTAIDDIKALGTILSIWAHPDDETYACAGIMAAAIQNGQNVVCVTATRGEAGVQDESRWPAHKLGDIREQELYDALRELGVQTHLWLGFSDGGCDAVEVAAAVEKLKPIFDTYRPDTVLTFGPDGITGHPDHIAVSKWVHAARDSADRPFKIFHAVESESRYNRYFKEADEHFNIYFNIESPHVMPDGQCDVCFELPDTIRQKKWAALAAMPSQTEGILRFLGPEKFHEAFATETFCCADK